MVFKESVVVPNGFVAEPNAIVVGAAAKGLFVVFVGVMGGINVAGVIVVVVAGAIGAVPNEFGCDGEPNAMVVGDEPKGLGVIGAVTNGLDVGGALEGVENGLLLVESAAAGAANVVGGGNVVVVEGGNVVVVGAAGNVAPGVAGVGAAAKGLLGEENEDGSNVVLDDVFIGVMGATDGVVEGVLVAGVGLWPAFCEIRLSLFNPDDLPGNGACESGIVVCSARLAVSLRSSLCSSGEK